MDKRKILFLIISIFIHFNQLNGQELQRYEFSSVHMGTEFQVILYAESDYLSNSASNAVFSKIEELNTILSDYLGESELNQLLNTYKPDQSIKISAPLFFILKRSIIISNHTEGFFDITIGPYSQIWRGINRELDPRLPSEQELKEAKKHVGFQYVVLDNETQTVKLKKDKMRIDLGGIGKGFAADEGLEVLREYGINSALINAGGDISVGDPPPGKDGWNISIPVYNRPNIDLIVSNESVNTSGNLYQYIEIDGIKYSHIINPKTGLGNTESTQVTVVSKNGTNADAYATALNVMGLEKAREIVNGTPDLEAIIQTVNEGIPQIWISKGLKKR